MENNRIQRGDRRRDIRIIVRASLKAGYRRYSSDHVFSTEGFINSISRSGVSFRTRESLQNMSYVDLEILLPYLNKVIKPTIRIVWKKEDSNRYGGEIANIGKSDLSLLDRYINYPLTTKKIEIDRRMRHDPSALPGGKDRRKKNK